MQTQYTPPEASATKSNKTAVGTHTASVKFDPAFLAIADEFGMIPERMAERILSAFAATPPSHLIIKGRKGRAATS